MSESPQNAEIEDVLSSIRRLVAGSEGAARRSDGQTAEEGVEASWPADGLDEASGIAAPQPSEAPPQNAAPALVLTEADRVDPEEDPEVDHAAYPPEASAPSAPRHGPAEGDGEDAGASGRPEALFHAASARTVPDVGAAPGTEARTGSAIADAEAPNDSRRQGFGFGGARRDDPVKHIPLASRAQPGTAESAAPVAERSAPSPSDRPLEEQSPRHSGPSAADAVPAGDDVGGEPPPRRMRSTEARAMPGTAAGEQAPEAAGAADAAESGASMESMDAPPQNRRMGPIISEAFAHPPAERGDTAAPREGEGQADAFEEVSDVAGMPSAADPDAHPERNVAEASAADIADDDLDDMPGGEVRGVDAGESPAEESRSTPTASMTDAAVAHPPAQAVDSAPAARSTPDGQSSVQGEATVPAAGRPESPGIAAAPGGAGERGAEAPMSPDQCGRDNLFADRLDGVDPALLRNMVRDVLREELEGETGRKASARIRELIRDEVRQALGVQDSD